MGTSDNQLLRNPNIEPSDEVISAAIGESYKAYTELLKILPKHDIELTWRYYNDGKAWLGKALAKWQTSRGTDKEKTVFWLSAWDGLFKLSFFFGEKLRAGLRELPVGKTTKALIDEAKQTGKLKFFPVIIDINTPDLPTDIAALIEYQIKNK